MTTRLDLRNLCRRRLGDLTAPYHWSDLQVNQWINDAIADYSIHFPRQLSEEISTTAQVQQYDLPEGFIAVLSVEYPALSGANVPADELPPTYLQHLSYTELDFWELSGRYDVVHRDDGSDASELWLSDSPAEDEVIRLEYLAEHASLDDDGDLCTVPDRHLELLVLFVRWAALQELAATEARSPDLTTSALSTLDINASRAEQTYRQQLEATLRAEGKSAVVGWVRERVY
jgi:hypothetical protein